MNKENIIKYGNPILAVSLVAILGTIFTNIGLDWFMTLNTPGDWLNMSIIPIVWTVIYSLFTIYLLYIVNKEKMNKTLFYYLVINGILNILWCFIFFTTKSIFLGQITIIINLLSSFFLLKKIFDTSKTWGYILMIYPTWLTIATTLNTAIWILN
jgi:tryptophan-rich sensory protein